MANPIVTSLPAYVEEKKSELISKSVLGGDSIALFNLMVGVNGPTTLNLLDTDVTLQDGKECGFDAQGTQTITQRTITPAILKVNMEYCPKNFLGTYASYMVRIAAGKETLPYEEKFIGSVLDSINEKNEKMIFQGTGSGAECEGLNSILGTDGAQSFVKGATVWESLKAAYTAIPEKVLVKDDVALLIAPANFRAFVQELVSANLYHYDEKDYNGYVYLPGTNVKVINTPGLAGTDKVIGGSLSGIYVGVDMANDAEDFRFWFSDDDDVFKLKVSYALGVQVAFPDEYVFGDVK